MSRPQTRSTQQCHVDEDDTGLVGAGIEAVRPPGVLMLRGMESTEATTC